MEAILDYIYSFSGTVVTIFTFYVIYILAQKILDQQAKGKSDWTLIRSIILFGIFFVGAIAVILALPMGDSLRGQITSLLGIVISAVLALSSATFFGNGLAGVMLRIINSSKPGDFIQVNDHFGRITERGLFHTELQTENRDLTTIPNLYLVNNPVKVTRSSGTFISGTVSLGYDVNRQKIEKALIEAATNAELTDPFVRITELGDFSVLYVVYGMVQDIKTVLTRRSRLNAMILDSLHEANIEIVSPSFMNQRPTGDTVFIPKKVRKHEEVKVAAEAPENLIFDKADEAESIEKRKERLAELEVKIKALQEELKATTEGDDKHAECSKKIARCEELKAKMLERLDNQLGDLGAK